MIPLTVVENFRYLSKPTSFLERPSECVASLSDGAFFLGDEKCSSFQHDEIKNFPGLILPIPKIFFSFLSTRKVPTSGALPNVAEMNDSFSKFCNNIQ